MGKKHREKAIQRWEHLKKLEKEKDEKKAKREAKAAAKREREAPEDEAAPAVAQKTAKTAKPQDAFTAPQPQEEPRTASGQAVKKKWRAE